MRLRPPRCTRTDSLFPSTTPFRSEELDGADTPLGAMTRGMAGKAPGAVGGQLGRFGFTGNKATTQIAKLSGGERARLALALITREAPHLLILDEPPNHLDVDARARKRVV